MEHQPDSMGRYSREGTLWEGFIPFWKNENNMYLSPDSNSNPILFYIKWVITSNVGGFNGTIMNDVYTDGPETCPYSMDQWTYLWDYNWYQDPTLTFTCTKRIDKDNCVTDWNIDEHGNKVWGGKEKCEPVSWEECKIVKKAVDFPAVKTNCDTVSTI